MDKSTRVGAVVATTMALVIAGTAAVAAAGPRDRDDVRGFGGPHMAGKPGPGFGGMRGLDGSYGGGFRGLDADIERTERSIQTAEGTTVARTEQGVVDSVAADSLSFSLASGEAVTVVIDEDTQVVGYEETEVTSRRGFTRTRIAATELEPGDIAAGAEVVVMSDAQDDADFIASRIVIRPATEDAAEEPDTDVDAADAADADASEAVVEDATESSAAATDA